MNNSQHSDLDALLGELSLEEADRLREVWHLVGPKEPIAASQPHETEAALQQFTATLDQQRVASPHAVAQQRHTDRGAHRLPRRGRLQRMIVLVVLLFLGALGGFWWMQPVTKTAPLGERLTLTLPDGSTAELNSGSSLRYARRFGEVRLVELQGEAYFDVIQEARPFIVHTFNAQVEVLGTRFNVRAWPYSDERSSTIALESGRVAVAPKSNLEQITTLEPGQTHRIVSERLETEEATSLSVEEATAWRRGDFIAMNQRLGIILAEVERRFAVDIMLHPTSLREKRMSLALRQPASAEAVVRDLAAPLGLAYRKTSNGFALYVPTP